LLNIHIEFGVLFDSTYHLQRCLVPRKSQWELKSLRCLVLRKPQQELKFLKFLGHLWGHLLLLLALLAARAAAEGRLCYSYWFCFLAAGYEQGTCSHPGRQLTGL
jgi:hypothetical protein